MFIWENFGTKQHLTWPCNCWVSSVVFCIQKCKKFTRTRKYALCICKLHLCSHLTMGTKKQQFSLVKCISYTWSTLRCCNLCGYCNWLLQDPGLYSENKEQCPVHHFVKKLQYFNGVTPFKTHMGMMALQVHCNAAPENLPWTEE